MKIRHIIGASIVLAGVSTFIVVHSMLVFIICLTTIAIGVRVMFYTMVKEK
jgi:hypothetical protein